MKVSGSGRPGVRLALAALALAMAAASGAAVTGLLLADATPATLREPPRVTSAPVTQRSFDDARTVELALTLGADASLTAPASGRVTALTCRPDMPFSSGESNLSIDGAPLLNLATSVPLWRDLGVGDEGADALALRAELIRLGSRVAPEGALDAGTMTAVADLFHKAGDSGFKTGTVPIERVLWLPGPETSVTACLAAVGTRVSEGAEVASLPGGLTAAQLVRLPDRVAPGKRVLVIDGERFPTDGEGRVTDPGALARISSMPSYLQATRNAMTSITGSYVLSDQVAASVVAPGALYDVDQATACVIADGKPLAVTLIGSELGRSFVTFDTAEPPAAVDLEPDQTRPCR